MKIRKPVDQIMNFKWARLLITLATSVIAYYLAFELIHSRDSQDFFTLESIILIVIFVVVSLILFLSDYWRIAKPLSMLTKGLDEREVELNRKSYKISYAITLAILGFLLGLQASTGYLAFLPKETGRSFQFIAFVFVIAWYLTLLPVMIISLIDGRKVSEDE